MKFCFHDVSLQFVCPLPCNYCSFCQFFSSQTALKISVGKGSSGMVMVDAANKPRSSAIACPGRHERQMW